MSVLRAARFVLVALAAALLVSCTFTKFAYNQADTLASWWADEYVNLEGAQKDDFQKRFDRFYAWHRYEQLPDYAQFMRTARGRLADGLTRDEVLWFVDGLRTRVRTAARQAAPDAAALLATLTPAQIENLQKKWEKDNRKYVKEHKLNGTPEERQEAQAKRIVKQVKDWLAPLTNEQEQRVLVMVRELPQLDRENYQERLRRQKELLKILAHRNEDRERFTQRVTEWMVNWERGRSPDYQRQVEASWQKRADFFVAVERMLTAEQRATALTRVQGYADDFSQLARRETSNRTASAPAPTSAR